MVLLLRKREIYLLSVDSIHEPIYSQWPNFTKVYAFQDFLPVLATSISKCLSLFTPGWHFVHGVFHFLIEVNYSVLVGLHRSPEFNEWTLFRG